MQCEYYALEGLSDLVNTIKKVHANFNPDLEIEALLRTMFDPRITLAQQVSAQLEQHFGDKVFDTVIPRNVRLAEAPSYGKPVSCFDPASKGAQAYVAFGARTARPRWRDRSRHRQRRSQGRDHDQGQTEGPRPRTGCAAGAATSRPAARERRRRRCRSRSCSPAGTSRAPGWTRALQELAASIRRTG